MSFEALHDVVLVLYLIQLYPNINRTSLNKVLFFLDAQSVQAGHGRLSTFHYKKMPFGPVPVEIQKAIGALKASRIIKEEPVIEGPYRAWIYSISDTEKAGLVLTSLERFTTEAQRKVIHEGIQTLRLRTASYLSEESHKFECWKKAEWNQEIRIEEAASEPHLATVMQNTSAQRELF